MERLKRLKLYVNTAVLWQDDKKIADKNIFKNLSPTIRLSNKDIKQC